MEDIDIVKRIQTGDSESYSLLIEKYHRHLLNFIYRLLGNEEVVEDIGQEVFFSVYKSMRSFNAQRGVPFAAWLFITARNRCISELRKKNRHTVSMDMLGGLPTDAKSPEESASQKERMAAIHNALEQLPEPFKQTILQSLRGDSPDAIARNLHISPGTVKSRLSRARQKMKLLLHGSLGGNVYGRF